MKEPHILYYINKCKDCGRCVESCPVNAISRTEAGYLSGDACIACGKCEKVCLTNARKLVGTAYSSDELLELILKDKIYYMTSDGGVTLSGGEVFYQADFAAQLLEKCQKEDVNTAIETTFFTSKHSIDRVLPYVNQIMCDVKSMDSVKHKVQTGVDNKIILDNIRYVSGKYRDIPITVRIPYIPGFNDSQKDMIDIFEFVKEIRTADRIEILPYHRLGSSKYEAMGVPYKLGGVLPVPKERLTEYVEIGEKLGLKVYIDASQ